MHRLCGCQKISPHPQLPSPSPTDANQLRLVAQTLAGRALTPEPGQEEVKMREQEQRAIDSLLSS